jgi:hypothetical protein
MMNLSGVKAQDLDRLIVWTTDRGEVIAQPSWSLTEALALTFSNLVKISTHPVPEIEATLKITAAMETGVRLIHMAFAPSDDQRLELLQRLFPEQNNPGPKSHEH